jgi:diaminobutyrate-2-oxoglutarate transaminase
MDTHSGIDLPAGIIVETVQAEGGVNVASNEWLRELRAICDDYGVILIVDEVQTGMRSDGSLLLLRAGGHHP